MNRDTIRAVLTAAVLCLSSTSALAASTEEIGARVDPPSGVAVAADFLVARPFGLVATVAGTGVFLAALPFAIMAQDVGTPARLLVAQPARFTFARPLGESATGEAIVGP